MRTSLITVALLLVLGLIVTQLPMRAQIDSSFFFAEDSAALDEVRLQEKRFGSQEMLLVIARSEQLETETYLTRIQQLTEALDGLSGVVAVRSLSNGPEDLEDARESPIWQRLLLYSDGKASNLMLVLGKVDAQIILPQVLQVLEQHQAPGFDLMLAGVPYVVYSIGNELQVEFKRLGLIALLVFTLLLSLLYRNLAMVLGALMACGCAAVAALALQITINGGLGLLTANLITIAFVLTLMHTVFITQNARRIACENLDGASLAALKRTLPVSAWCALTTLLGFASLMMVDAQPLRELGSAGVATTLVALAAAYLVLPLYLPAALARDTGDSESALGKRLKPIPTAAAIVLLLLSFAIGVGSLRLNTDPSLLDYFDEQSQVHQSLQFVDSRAGSNPLNISVSWRPRTAFDNEQGYDRLWALQRALQEHPQVGTVVSLPVLMAEADRSTIGKLLPWNWILDLLQSDALDRVAAPFVTADRGEAMFMLRMVEADRVQERSTVIDDIHQLIRQQGFSPVTTGGLYALQAKLADAVALSLVEGLALLLALFALVAWLVARQLRAAVLMLLCALAVPLASLGALGWLQIPLDIIATPAASVAVGVASDSLLHLAAAWRVARQRGAIDPAAAALREQGPGIFAGALIVLAGFAVFFASAFPPSQRFGLAVLLGTVVAAIMALLVLPAALRCCQPSRRQNSAATDAPLKRPS